MTLKSYDENYRRFTCVKGVYTVYYSFAAKGFSVGREEAVEASFIVKHFLCLLFLVFIALPVCSFPAWNFISELH